MWKGTDGSSVRVNGNLVTIVRPNGQREIMSLHGLNRKKIGEALHSRGYRKVA
jgi:hypothetical protein